MGYYVNPPNETKEQFLAQHGEPYQDGQTAYEAAGPDSRAVCLVGNGIFTAAAIVYDERELTEFTLATDLRPKQWYVVPVAELREVSPPGKWDPEPKRSAQQ